MRCQHMDDDSQCRMDATRRVMVGSALLIEVDRRSRSRARCVEPGTLGCMVDDVRVSRPAREPPTARPIGIPVPSAPDVPPCAARARGEPPRKPTPALDGGDTMVPRSVKKTAILMTLVTCSLGVGVSSATADQPAGRCPSDYDMVSAGRWGADGRAIDKNDDGRVCQKPLPDGESFNVIDNNAQ